jgi:hypothetical protein
VLIGGTLRTCGASEWAMNLNGTSFAIGGGAGLALGVLVGYVVARLARRRVVDTPDSWRYAMSVRAAAERERLACFAELDIAKRRLRTLEHENARLMLEQRGLEPSIDGGSGPSS